MVAGIMNSGSGATPAKVASTDTVKKDAGADKKSSNPSKQFPFRNLNEYRAAKAFIATPGFPRPARLPEDFVKWCGRCCYNNSHTTEEHTSKRVSRNGNRGRDRDWSRDRSPIRKNSGGDDRGNGRGDDRGDDRKPRIIDDRDNSKK